MPIIILYKHSLIPYHGLVNVMKNTHQSIKMSLENFMLKKRKGDASFIPMINRNAQRWVG